MAAKIYLNKISLCLLLGGMALLTQGAYADNPVSWDFFVETTGNDASWLSTTNLDTGFSNHNYTYEITQAEVQVNILGWTSILSEIAVEDRTGGGSFGLLPAVLVSETFAADDNAVTVDLGVDSFGQGFADLTGVQLGSVPVLGDVSGIRLGGNIVVTAVPEPASLALLGGVGATLLIRRPVPGRSANR